MSKYLGTIEQVRVSGAMKTMRNIVVYDDALVVARGSAFSSSAADNLTAGLPGLVGGKREAKNKLAEQQAMSPDQVAALHKVNEKISVNQVRRATLKKVVGGSRRLTLELDGGAVQKFTYVKTQANKKTGVVPLLREVLGDRLQTKLKSL